MIVKDSLRESTPPSIFIVPKWRRGLALMAMIALWTGGEEDKD